MKTLVATFCATLVASQAHAQSEAALRDYFEGKTVVVKIDMPATQAGIDVYADARRPIDFDEYTRRVKDSGIALRSGESVMITKVRVKDKLIEFQLGCGGFGTFSDDTSGSVYVPTESKSKREKETKNAEEKKRRIAEQRLHAGSRFNLRYQDGVPSGITPGEVMAALAEYVEFPFTDRVTRPGVKGTPSASPAATRSTALYKGMSWQQAQDALGPPEKTSDRMEGKLKVTTATFSRDDQRIEAEFVEGVMIRYSISSK